jgi:hypothetical protein
VADEQLSGTVAERLERPFFQLFIQIGAGGYEIAKRQQPKVSGINRD